MVWETKAQGRNCSAGFREEKGWRADGATVGQVSSAKRYTRLLPGGEQRWKGGTISSNAIRGEGFVAQKSEGSSPWLLHLEGEEVGRVGKIRKTLSRPESSALSRRKISKYGSCTIQELKKAERKSGN